MSGRPRVTASLTALLVAVALLVALPGGALAAERTVSVTADATLTVPNDSASLGFSVSAVRPTKSAALHTASARASRVIAAVQTIAGVGPGDVKTGRVNVSKVSRGRHPRFRAGEGIGVTLHEPANAGALIGVAIEAGARGVSGPNYFVGDTDAASARVLGVAFAKAQARAAVLAAAAGATLGPALEIDEGEGVEFLSSSAAKDAPVSSCGSASATAPVATTKRCTAAPPTKPGRSTVSATVHVIFELR